MTAGSTKTPAHEPSAKPAVAALACGLAALALYALTASHGVEWQDSGLHQYRIITGRLENPLGLALSHPLHYWLGRAALAVAPGGGLEPAWRLNLLSAFWGAVGVGVLAGVVAAITRNLGAAVLAAAALLFSHTYWQMSALTETYTLAAALMTIEWALLWQYARTRRPWWLVAVCAVNGLHVANHLLGLLTLATYGVLALERVIRRRLHFGWLFVAAAAWIIAAAPYWTLVLEHGRRTGHWATTIYSAFFGLGSSGKGFAGDVLNAKLSWPLVKNTTMILGYNFPSLVLPIAFWGLLKSFRKDAGAVWDRSPAGLESAAPEVGIGRRPVPQEGEVRPSEGRIFRNVLLAQSIIIFAFVCRYSIRDQFTFFVPVCVVAAFWFGVGAAWFLERPRNQGTKGAREKKDALKEDSSFGSLTSRPLGPSRGRLVFLALNVTVLPLAVYLTMPDLARKYNLLGKEPYPIPYRDAYRHFLQPWKFNDDSAVRFARDALGRIAPDGWLLGGPTAMYAAACDWLTHEGPPAIRLYADRTCLNQPDLPPLTNDALRVFLEYAEAMRERGRMVRVLAAPSPAVDALWGTDFNIDKSDLFWRVELKR